MQTAGKSVALIVKFASRVKLSENDLYAGDFEVRMNPRWDTPSVILDGNAHILV